MQIHSRLCVSLLTSRICGLTAGILDAEHWPTRVSCQTTPGVSLPARGDPCTPLAATRHSLVDLDQDWWIPSPLHGHKCCFQSPAISTGAVMGTLENASLKNWGLPWWRSG